MKITIQELHAYNNLVSEGRAPEIPCVLNQEHMRTLPWLDEKDRVCQICLACDTKIFLSQEAEQTVKYYIYINK